MPFVTVAKENADGPRREENRNPAVRTGSTRRGLLFRCGAQEYSAGGTGGAGQIGGGTAHPLRLRSAPAAAVAFRRQREGGSFAGVAGNGAKTGVDRGRSPRVGGGAAGSAAVVGVGGQARAAVFRGGAGGAAHSRAHRRAGHCQGRGPAGRAARFVRRSAVELPGSRPVLSARHRLGEPDDSGRFPASDGVAGAAGERGRTDGCG
jgi:hypothetical protein